MVIIEKGSGDLPIFESIRLRSQNEITTATERQQPMSYYFSTLTDTSFEEVLTKVADELKKEGFGILTEIDVRETLKKKLDVNFQKYKILGACNPPFAYQALQVENKIGMLLPCNVIVQELPDGKVEVSAIDPVQSMQVVGNPMLKIVAEQVQAKLRNVISHI